MKRPFYVCGNLIMCALLVGVAVEFFQGNQALPLWMNGLIMVCFALSFFLRAITHFVEWFEEEEIHDYDERGRE